MAGWDSDINNEHGDLTDEELTFLRRGTVKKQLEKQWAQNSVPSLADYRERGKIWRSIKAGIGADQILFRGQRRLRIYGIAASIMILLMAGYLIHLQVNSESNIDYIVSTGKQDVRFVQLNDGSRVKMGAGSEISYPGHFKNAERLVKLKGQAYFKVAKDQNKPFKVEVDNIVVTALGTAFEIFCDPNRQTIETSLIEGKVRIEQKDRDNKVLKSTTLLPDQKYVFSKITGESYVLKTDMQKYLGWLGDESLDFKDEQLADIIPRMEYWYGCSIDFDSSLSHERFSFKIRNESIETILKLMSASSAASVKFRRTDKGNYVITKSD